MMTLNIGGEDYVFEFTFEAAEKKDLVQKMFSVMSGAYVLRNAGEDVEENAKSANAAMIDGISEMVADIPSICRMAFHAGLLENNPVSEEVAKELMKTYMKDNKYSFKKLYEDFRKCMEDDGFFGLSGIEGMLLEMEAKEEKTEKKPEKKQTTGK